MATEVKQKRSHKAIYTGLIIIAIGVLWLLRKMDIFLPGWIFSWQMLLIVIGVGVGMDNRFRNPASWVLIGIGGGFLIDEWLFIPYEVRDLFWPLLVIVIGVIVAVRPRSRNKWKTETSDTSSYGAESSTGESGTHGFDSTIDSVSIFNGLKRNIHSKRFKGGETVSIFGGTEINLLQADIDKVAHLEATVIFGGLKLIVPKNWEVRSEVTSILAGVEDKRFSAVEVVPDEKVLVLTGTVIFGGIDIVSY